MSHDGLLSTLSIEYATEEYLDKSFYQSAVHQTNLRFLDYYHARVTHNPQYSNLLGQEYTHLVNPRTQQKVYHSLEETTVTQTQVSTGVHQEQVTSVSIKTISPDEQLANNSLVDSFLEIAKESPNYKILVGLLAFSLVITNVQITHPVITPIIMEINSVLIQNFTEMFKYMEVPTHRRTPIRKEFNTIMKQVLGR